MYLAMLPHNFHLSNRPLAWQSRVNRSDSDCLAPGRLLQVSLADRIAVSPIQHWSRPDLVPALSSLATHPKHPLPLLLVQLLFVLYLKVILALVNSLTPLAFLLILRCWHWLLSAASRHLLVYLAYRLDRRHHNLPIVPYHYCLILLKVRHLIMKLLVPVVISTFSCSTVSAI